MSFNMSDFSIVALSLAGLGIAMPPEVFIAGLFLGLAGALSASRILAAGMVNGAKPLGLVGTLINGIFVPVVGIMGIDHYWPTFPPQFAMAMLGFFSAFIGPFLLKIASRFSRRGDEIADRALEKVLPGRNDD